MSGFDKISLAMPNHVTVVAIQDPQWLLKLLVAAVALTLVLLIGAHLVRARRNKLVLAFLVACASVLAAHFAVGISLSSWGLLAAVGATFVTLLLGVRYVLETGPLAALAVALATTAVLIAGLVSVVVIGGVI
jgi:hypothetical protein